MLNALVESKAAIKADGGRVILIAKAADAVLSAQVNNSEIIQARTMAELTGGGGGGTTGSIKLLASGGAVHVAGTLTPRRPKGGKGGKIETSGNKVTVAGDAVITTKAASGQNGSWLIDPNGFHDLLRNWQSDIERHQEPDSPQRTRKRQRRHCNELKRRRSRRHQRQRSFGLVIDLGDALGQFSNPGGGK